MAEDNKDAIGMNKNETERYSFLDWLEWHRGWLLVAGSISIILMILFLMFLSRLTPELQSARVLNYLGYLIFFSFVIAIFLFMVGVVQIFNRLPFTRMNQKAASLFSDEERLIRLKIKAEMDELLFSEKMQKEDGTSVDDWREVLANSRTRLMHEHRRLLKRGTKYLISGICLLLLGVAVLGGLFLHSYNFPPDTDSIITFIVSYLPRLSMVVAIEGLAVFCLRLYAVTERELLYNKNKTMNIELRLTAGLMLVGTKEDADKFESLSNHLAREGLDDVLGKKSSVGGMSAEKLIKILLKTLRVK